MEITTFQWIAFLAAIVYLLILPGANIIRTMGWAQKKHYNPIELLVVSFGISLAILVLATLALALPVSIGVNFYTLMALETLVIVASTKEVVGFVARLVRGTRSGA
jgi:threonine/homoserine/homoserine lactone efflux protein